MTAWLIVNHYCYGPNTIVFCGLNNFWSTKQYKIIKTALRKRGF